MTCLTSPLLLLGAIFTILTSSKVEGGLTLRKACGELYCEGIKLILETIYASYPWFKLRMCIKKESYSFPISLAHNFCSPTDHRCLPCETICDPGRNNHDQNRCETDCQGEKLSLYIVFNHRLAKFIEFESS